MSPDYPARMGRLVRKVGTVTGALLAISAAPALAQDPGRWVETGRSSIPLVYYQGITSDPQRNLFFDGIHVGLYRTDSELNEGARRDDAIPPDVHAREGYNHIGDLSWDAAEGGRLLLPLECYYPGSPNGGNTCPGNLSEAGTGSIAVADPDTLAWRYYVKLDERDIRKAMWAEVSPDGTLVWTSAGDDLLAYATADITAANAAPAGAKIRPVRRVGGAVPPSGITGAAFIGERLFVAGQGGGPFRVWSIDLATGARELEIERAIVGESEGLDTVDALGGSLHWQIQPYNEENVPTYGVSNGTLLHFKPSAEVPAAAPAPACCAARPARIRLTIAPRRVRAGRMQRFRVRATAPGTDGRRRGVARASVHFAGRLFRTDARGRAVLRARLRVTGLRQGRASRVGLRKGRAHVRVLPRARR
jgi:hypothetical protein